MAAQRSVRPDRARAVEAVKSAIAAKLAAGESLPAEAVRILTTAHMRKVAALEAQLAPKADDEPLPEHPLLAGFELPPVEDPTRDWLIELLQRAAAKLGTELTFEEYLDFAKLQPASASAAPAYPRTSAPSRPAPRNSAPARRCASCTRST
ncbi:MAG: hypothetical protein KY476_06870 [Planctomycetes bacterium]|nr:hypothetical protein [Planctomycetota bacterium]